MRIFCEIPNTSTNSKILLFLYIYLFKTTVLVRQMLHVGSNLKEINLIMFIVLKSLPPRSFFCLCFLEITFQVRISRNHSHRILKDADILPSGTLI